MDGKGSSSPISGLRASSNDLETHPAGSRPTRPMVINASCASKAASTLTAEKYTRVIRVSATPSKNPPCLRFTCQSWRYAVDPQGGGGSYAAEATHKLGRIDHSARVRPYADLPVALGGMHAKFDPPPVDFGDFGLTCDDAPYYSRGEMADSDLGANRAFAGVKIGLDRVERGVLHDHDHDRRREHRRQSRILEPVREMLGLDDEGEGALGSRWYLPPGMPSLRRESEHYPQQIGIHRRGLRRAEKALYGCSDRRHCCRDFALS